MSKPLGDRRNVHAGLNRLGCEVVSEVVVPQSRDAQPVARGVEGLVDLLLPQDRFGWLGGVSVFPYLVQQFLQGGRQGKMSVGGVALRSSNDKSAFGDVLPPRRMGLSQAKAGVAQETEGERVLGASSALGRIASFRGDDADEGRACDAHLFGQFSSWRVLPTAGQGRVLAGPVVGKLEVMKNLSELSARG